MRKVVGKLGTPTTYHRPLNEEEVEYLFKSNCALYGKTDTAVFNMFSGLGEWPSVMEPEAVRTYIQKLIDGFVGSANFLEVERGE